MTRVKRSVHARKKRRATLALAKGYRGEAHSSYKRAKEAVMKADSYAYRDRRNRKRDFRRLWITRINAAARQNDMTYATFMHGLKLAGHRDRPQDPRRHRRPRSRDLPPICRARPRGSGGLTA
jgi:large subunit ribosomal protein L20